MLSELLQKYRKVKKLNDIINDELCSNCKIRILNRHYKFMDEEEKEGFKDSKGYMDVGENIIYFDILADLNEIFEILLHEHGHYLNGRNEKHANEFTEYN